MGWKTKIARKKAKALLQIAFLVSGLSVLNGVIEYLKVIPSPSIVLSNPSVEVPKPLEFGDSSLVSVEDVEMDDIEVKTSLESILRSKTATFTAYNTVEGQTDLSPCIGADGTDLCEYDGCVVAQNGVPFGTKIEVEGFGICVVKDRKASRYDSSWIDICFKHDVKGALAFGKKQLTYKIIE